MEFSKLVSGDKVAVPLCRDMERNCRDNADKAARDLPFFEGKLLDAHDAVTAWTESLGKLEHEKRKRDLLNLKEKVASNHSDGRYWKLRAQAWRQCMAAHPELAALEVGAKCSHGYIVPMCVVDRPVLKSVPADREPGSDDE